MKWSMPGVSVPIEGQKEYEPVFRLENGQLMVSYLNLQQGNIVVNFYKTAKAFLKTMPATQSQFQRKYDLSKLNAGEYTISLNTGNDVHYHSFRIK
ncbi:MAG: hypothetical protein HC896_06095 [Bacteroidales bacterium]|nr:hypothetical protein [Bacteroidales bacterium]